MNRHSGFSLALVLGIWATIADFNRLYMIFFCDYGFFIRIQRLIGDLSMVLNGLRGARRQARPRWVIAVPAESQEVAWGLAVRLVIRVTS